MQDTYWISETYYEKKLNTSNIFLHVEMIFWVKYVKINFVCFFLLFTVAPRKF